MSFEWSVDSGAPFAEGPLPRLDEGQRVGPYRVEARLGHGGMGEVYRARHEESGQRVALKVLRQRKAGEQQTRFQREAELAARLSHVGTETALQSCSFTTPSACGWSTAPAAPSWRVWPWKGAPPRSPIRPARGALTSSSQARAGSISGEAHPACPGCAPGAALEVTCGALAAWASTASRSDHAEGSLARQSTRPVRCSS